MASHEILTFAGQALSGLSGSGQSAPAGPSDASVYIAVGGLNVPAYPFAPGGSSGVPGQPNFSIGGNISTTPLFIAAGALVIALILKKRGK